MHYTKRMIALLLSTVITCSSLPATAYASTVSNELSYATDEVADELTLTVDQQSEEEDQTPLQEPNEEQLEDNNMSESETTQEDDRTTEPETDSTTLENSNVSEPEDDEIQTDVNNTPESDNDEIPPDANSAPEADNDEIQPENISVTELDDNEPENTITPEPEYIISGEIPSPATSETSEDSETSDIRYEHVTYINPLYEDVIQASDLVQPDESEVAVYSNSDYVSTLSEVGSQLRGSLKERQENITVYYQSTEEYYRELTSDILECALEHTGNPIEGDYLRWQFGGYEASISYQIRNGFYYITMNYTFTYYTSSAQESELNQAVQQVLNQLNLNGKTDYEKVYDIYRYICQHVTYDYTNLNIDSYNLKYTAYAALINKTAVCQGYALLFYRLSLEVGIDARLISGIGNGGNHGWNIVRLNGVYYNLDATWDAPRTVGNYIYFLRCDNNFSDHTRDQQYADADFYSRYPMGRRDYSSQTIDIAGSTISLPQASYVYNGSEIRPSFTVKLADDTLKENIDYSVSYSNNINAGTADITIAGIDIYSGSLTQTFKIAPKSITSASVSSVPAQNYTGQQITPVISVMDGSTTLSARKDYTVSYSNNTQPGTARINITGIGNYTDTLSITFKIQAISGNGWVQTNGKWYYYVNGRRKTDWLLDKNKWYYLNSSGVMLTGWQKISGTWYYLNSSGVMLTGWQKISGKWYYLNSSGVMLTGWQKISGKWYYLNSSGVMLTGWQKISGTWYYLNSSGVMLTGWQKISGTWYYLNSSGAMLTGWQKISGTWYYLNSSGAMLTGWQKISNKWYYLNKDGSMVSTNIRIDGKMNLFNSSGVWMGSVS